MLQGGAQLKKTIEEQVEETQGNGKRIDQNEFHKLLDRIETELKNPLNSIEDNSKLELALSKMAQGTTLIIKQSIIKNGEFHIPGKTTIDGNNTIREFIKDFSTDAIRLRRIINLIDDPEIKESIARDLDLTVMNNTSLISSYYKWINKNTANFNDETQRAFKQIFNNAKFNFASALSKKHHKLAKQFIFSDIKNLAKIISNYKK